MHFLENFARWMGVRKVNFNATGISDYHRANLEQLSADCSTLFARLVGPFQAKTTQPI